MDGSFEITGAWVNKYTGEVVNVHNNVIDGDQMILITDRGQIDMNEFSNNYIQASDDIYDESGKVIDHAPMRADEFPVNQSMLDMPIGNTIQNLQGNTQNIQQINKKEEPESFKILDKFFAKIDNKENLISVDIDFNILPKSQLSTIVDFLDISLEDLSKYISEKIVNTDNLPGIIFNKLQYWMAEAK